MVTVVWETWLHPGTETEGLRLTRQIWSDMQRFDGYLSHQLLVDQDAANHLLIVSDWRNREAADRIKDEYAGSETVRLLTPLLLRPRNRWVFANKTTASSDRFI